MFVKHLSNLVLQDTDATVRYDLCVYVMLIIVIVIIIIIIMMMMIIIIMIIILIN